MTASSISQNVPPVPPEDGVETLPVSSLAVPSDLEATFAVLLSEPAPAGPPTEVMDTEAFPPVTFPPMPIFQRPETSLPDSGDGVAEAKVVVRASAAKSGEPGAPSPEVETFSAPPQGNRKDPVPPMPPGSGQVDAQITIELPLTRPATLVTEITGFDAPVELPAISEEVVGESGPTFQLDGRSTMPALDSELGRVAVRIDPRESSYTFTATVRGECSPDDLPMLKPTAVTVVSAPMPEDLAAGLFVSDQIPIGVDVSVGPGDTGIPMAITATDGQSQEESESTRTITVPVTEMRAAPEKTEVVANNIPEAAGRVVPSAMPVATGAVVPNLPAAPAVGAPVVTAPPAEVKVKVSEAKVQEAKASETHTTGRPRPIITQHRESATPPVASLAQKAFRTIRVVRFSNVLKKLEPVTGAIAEPVRTQPDPMPAQATQTASRPGSTDSVAELIARTVESIVTATSSVQGDAPVKMKIRSELLPDTEVQVHRRGDQLHVVIRTGDNRSYNLMANSADNLNTRLSAVSGNVILEIQSTAVGDATDRQGRSAGRDFQDGQTEDRE